MTEEDTDTNASFVSDKVLPRRCGTCGRYQLPKKGKKLGLCNHFKVKTKPSFWCYPTHWVQKKKKPKRAVTIKPDPKQEKKVMKRGDKKRTTQETSAKQQVHGSGRNTKTKKKNTKVHINKKGR